MIKLKTSGYRRHGSFVGNPMRILQSPVEVELSVVLTRPRNNGCAPEPTFTSDLDLLDESRPPRVAAAEPTKECSEALVLVPGESLRTRDLEGRL